MVDAQHFFDFVDVVTNAVGAPQIRHGVLVTRVVLFQTLEQRRVQIGIVSQQRLVELLKRPGFDLLAKEVVGRHDHVVTGTPGEQLAFQGFIGVKHVIHRLDAAGLFEVGQGVGADVVRPVINMHSRRGLHADSQRDTCTHQQGFAK